MRWGLPAPAPAWLPCPHNWRFVSAGCSRTTLDTAGWPSEYLPPQLQPWARNAVQGSSLSPYPALKHPDNLAAALQAADLLLLRGRGMDWRWGLWGGGCRLAGKPGSLWTGLGGGGEGGWSDLDIIPCAWHPRVRRCLSKCVPPLHKGEAWGVGRWCGWLEGGAETDPCKKWVVNNLFCAKTSTIMFQIVTHLKCRLSVSDAGLIQTRESL